MILFWFRKGLRLHDNPALIEALKCSPDKMIPVFLLDPWFGLHARVGRNRWIFLLETLKDLDASLRSLGSRLYVIRGSPEVVFPLLFQQKELLPSHVFYELDTEPYANERDAKIEKIAKSFGVKMVGVNGHTLVKPDVILHANKGKVPLTYTAFLKAMEKVTVPLPLEAPTTLPPPGSLKLNAPNIPIHADKSRNLTMDAFDYEKRQLTYSSFGSETDFSVPTIQDLGYDASREGSPHKGGETVALKMLEKYFQNTKKVASFEKPLTSPCIMGDTTILSPHLKFGSLSARLFHKNLLEVYKKTKPHSFPPVSLMGQLYWREFFYLVSAKTENFDKIVGNPLCLKIDWWLQAGAKASSKEQIAMNHLDAWRNGRTGYPWIDAIMTQLRTEGWIHHLARHSVACFLTRGDLFISWERGVEVFDEFLLDSDWALNNANWMWLRYEKAYLNYSASAFFTQYFRVYSPIAFGKKYDKEGKYIKKYLPVLSKLPPKYIFEPWTAPLNIQKQSGCIIGVDYPKPIVMHDVVSKENMQKMKIAYSHGIRGYKPSEKEEVVDEEDDIITIESDEEPPSKKQRT